QQRVVPRQPGEPERQVGPRPGAAEVELHPEPLAVGPLHDTPPRLNGLTAWYHPDKGGESRVRQGRLCGRRRTSTPLAAASAASADSGRSSGCFSMSCSITRERAGGTAGFRPATGGACSVRCHFRFCCDVPPGNGGIPVRAKYSEHPRAYRSARGPTAVELVVC